MAFTTSRNYVGVQVTLTSNAVVYNLLDLINAVIAAETKYDGSAVCPAAARAVSIQNDPTSGGSVYIGDALLVAGASQPGRCAYVLGIGGSRQYGTGDNRNVDLGQLYVSPLVDDSVLNIEVLVS